MDCEKDTLFLVSAIKYPTRKDTDDNDARAALVLPLCAVVAKDLDEAKLIAASMLKGDTSRVKVFARPF